MNSYTSSITISPTIICSSVTVSFLHSGTYQIFESILRVLKLKEKLKNGQKEFMGGPVICPKFRVSGRAGAKMWVSGVKITIP